MNTQELLQVFLDEDHYKELSVHAYMLTGNKEDACDLLSDLLIEIYENPKMQNAVEPMAYFKTVLRNKAYNKHKRDKRTVPLSQDNEHSEAMGQLHDEVVRDYEERQSRLEWKERLQSFYSPEMAEAFIRRYADGYSTRELAKELEMTENALMQQFYRMRKRLKAMLIGMLGMIIFMMTGL